MSVSPARLPNVKADVRSKVSQDQVASDVARALEGLFEITSYRRFAAFNGNYAGMYARPTKTVRGSLQIEREVFVLVADYALLHARTITVAQEAMKAEQPRLQPDVVIIVHADADADENLRVWGREQGMTVMPIFRRAAGAMPPAAIVRQRLARELFASDSFQVTGPVSDDAEFFGRREQASALLRKLQAGRIEALFGLRKVGKTSMLNRVIELATIAKSPKVAMVDCSLRGFSDLNAADALKAVARTARLATEQGYAHVSQTIGKSDRDIMSTFESLWDSTASRAPLLIVFDEIDYITPDSPTSIGWATEFNEFWREFRAVIQEARRHSLTLSVLVSGVSSKSFRVAEIAGVENSVLHFVPESYLSPFESGAADAMINALGKRCGLVLGAPARITIAQTAARLPYWMRMVGSYIHRHVEIDGRPVQVDESQVRQLCDEFATTEGAEISRVALQNLRRVDRPMFDLLAEAARGRSIDSRQALPLLRYGLVQLAGNEVVVESAMVREGLTLLSEAEHMEAGALSGSTSGSSRTLDLDEGEWAEELAGISRRRNILERKTREFVRIVLKMSLPKERDWVSAVAGGLTRQRRAECAGLTPDSLMSHLYWKELGAVISREWTFFGDFFADKKRLQNAFDLLNERPDAHAKDVDLADIALQHRELAWLEERIAQ